MPPLPRRLRSSTLGLSSALASTLVLGCSSGGSAHSADAATDAKGTGDAGGAVSLTKLSVLSASGTDELQPAFAPDIHDYYVRCGATTKNALKVVITASPGATAALSSPSMSASAASQTVPVVADQNDAIVATATLGKTVASYWVRCLPPDFPHLTVTSFPDAGPPSPGFYLVGNAVAPVGEGGYAMVLDVHGVPVWYHNAGNQLAVTDVETVVPGAISYIPTSFVATKNFEVHTVNPPAVETLVPKGYATDEHELRALDHGHFMILSYPTKTDVDLTGLALTKAFDGGVVPLGPHSAIQDCTVVELDPSGTVYWTWNASDHFDAAAVSTYPQTAFGATPGLDGGTAYDVFHCNSIDVDPANGNLLVSARGMDSIFYIEKLTGKVLWKMGGKPASLDSATYVTVPDPFYRQHDARLLPGWSSVCHGGTGQVSLFDDQTDEPGPARGVIYDVVVGGGADAGSCDAGAGASGEAKVAWQYAGQRPSSGAGSVRSTSDGGHIIGWGIGVPVFTELDGQGHKRLEFAFGATLDPSYRAIKVPPSAFDLSVLRQTAGK